MRMQWRRSQLRGWGECGPPVSCLLPELELMVPPPGAWAMEEVTALPYSCGSLREPWPVLCLLGGRQAGQAAGQAWNADPHLAMPFVAWPLCLGTFCSGREKRTRQPGSAIGSSAPHVQSSRKFASLQHWRASARAFLAGGSARPPLGCVMSSGHPGLGAWPL